MISDQVPSSPAQASVLHVHVEQFSAVEILVFATSVSNEILKAGASRAMFLVWLLAAALTLCGCGRSASQSQQPSPMTNESGEQAVDAVLALNWYAEAEHGGYVAAKELGYFAKAGMNVTIRQGGPGAPNLVIQELAAGRISFAVSNADLVVLARARDVDIVAVAAPLQQSPRCIIVHESSGIESLNDLAGVQLAISDSRPFALWMKKKLPLTDVTMVPYSGQVGEFILNKNFAQQGYVFSEPYLARENDSNPKVLMLSDIGFNPYASLLVTTGDMIRNQPEIVGKMVSASVQGWRSYLDSPDEVNARIHADNAEMSPGALAFGAEAMRPLCRVNSGQPLCGMELERWQVLVDQIAELGEIDPGSVEASECFDTSFLPSAAP